jgi:hypothetical protein
MFLQENKFGVAVVVASAGMKGDADKNKELSQARAMLAREYLTKNFKFDDTKVKTIGVGKNGETGDEGRLEILVYPTESKAPASKKATAAR